jgi:hypothetical protein
MEPNEMRRYRSYSKSMARMIEDDDGATAVDTCDASVVLGDREVADDVR